MAESPIDPNVFETANAGFAQAIYEEYLKDPNGVAPEWRRLFESGRVGEKPAVSANGSGNGAGATSSAAPAAATPAGDGTGAPTKGAPMKGPAARLAANMNESLSVPTATTFREI